MTSKRLIPKTKRRTTTDLVRCRERILEWCDKVEFVNLLLFCELVRVRVRPFIEYYPPTSNTIREPHNRTRRLQIEWFE